MCWDPGTGTETASHPIRNDYLYSVIAAAQADAGEPQIETRTDLDSHANMPVVGGNAYILSNHNRSVEVSPYTPDYEPMKIPMVDAAVKYESPFDGKPHILVVLNALHVPSMDNNLLPPFMLRENGIEVRDTPKIQMEQPTEADHAITFPETGLRIPLSLWGTFSYFPTTMPTPEELMDPENVQSLTPTTWNPHSDVYARNEESMLDWEGNLKPPKDRELRMVLDDIPEDEAMVASMAVSKEEMAFVDALMTEETEPKGAVFGEASSLARALSDRAEEGEFKMSIGSTYASDLPNLMPASDDESSTSSGSETEEEWWDTLEQEVEDYMVSATTRQSETATLSGIALHQGSRT